MTPQAIFHLSFPVRSLQAAREFYCKYLGASVGRDNGDWLDILLFGHQITLHERPAEVLAPESRGVRHFGAILPWDQWQALADTLPRLGCPLLSGPVVAHAGTGKEQGYNVGCLEGVDPFAIPGAVPTEDGIHHPADRGRPRGQ